MNARGYGEFDWDGDESLFFFAAAATALFTFAPLLVSLISFKSLRPIGNLRSLVIRGILVGLAIPLLVLLRWADPIHVRGHLDYTLLFMIGAAAWIGIVGRGVLPLLGISIRDDVLERANPAAAGVAAAALAGTGIIYGLCNVGSGATIWTTIVPAVAATGVWLLGWFLLLASTRSAEQVAIDRDTATAIRLTAYLLATAIILGAAMAGDFVSYRQAAADLVRLGWPVVLLWLVAFVVEAVTRLTPQRPRGRVKTGAIPVAAMYLAAAAILVWVLR
jgi:hypothetical protein